MTYTAAEARKLSSNGRIRHIKWVKEDPDFDWTNWYAYFDEDALVWRDHDKWVLPEQRSLITKVWLPLLPTPQGGK